MINWQYRLTDGTLYKQFNTVKQLNMPDGAWEAPDNQLPRLLNLGDTLWCGYMNPDLLVEISCTEIDPTYEPGTTLYVFSNGSTFYQQDRTDTLEYLLPDDMYLTKAAAIDGMRKRLHSEIARAERRVQANTELLDKLNELPETTND